MIHCSMIRGTQSALQSCAIRRSDQRCKQSSAYLTPGTTAMWKHGGFELLTLLGVQRWSNGRNWPTGKTVKNFVGGGPLGTTPPKINQLGALWRLRCAGSATSRRRRRSWLSARCKIAVGRTDVPWASRPQYPWCAFWSGKRGKLGKLSR